MLPASRRQRGLHPTAARHDATTAMALTTWKAPQKPERFQSNVTQPKRLMNARPQSSANQFWRAR